MARRNSTWRILDPEPPDTWTGHFSYSCPNCGADAELPVVGRVIAQLSDGGLVFDPGPKLVPRKIQCRICRKRFESEVDKHGSPALEGSLREGR
jgi:hypothetical protein